MKREALLTYFHNTYITGLKEFREKSVDDEVQGS